MRTMRVPKKSGSFRTIYLPEEDTKRQLRALVPQLNLLAESLDVHHVQHGFTEKRSPVTNAKCHIGWEWTVSFDLSDFFDTVTLRMVSAAAWDKLAEPASPLGLYSIKECFVDGIAGQGLPTSPALANIAASPMDNEIMSRRQTGRFHEATWVYTRYADDLCFSCRSRAQVDWLLKVIPEIIEKHGFKVNHSKTKVQCALSGRRMITGVAVGERDVFAPRETKRRLRAAKHQLDHGFRKRGIRRLIRNSYRWSKKLPLAFYLRCQVQGLEEWCRLRPPADSDKKKGTIAKTAKAVVHAVIVAKTKVTGAVTRFFGRKIV